MRAERPTTVEYDPYYHGYLQRIGDGPIVTRLSDQIAELHGLLGGLRPGGSAYRYADGKWTIKQVIGHLADAERIFGMRATCIARGEVASLPGFDENAYVEEGAFDVRTLDSLLREFEHLRGANVEMFDGLPDAHWGRTGSANGAPASVRALAWILAGHLDHHMAVLRDRYAPAFEG